jgi:hypothetical protein
MDNFLKPYMVGDNPQVKESIIGTLSVIDVKWNYDFIGGKPERMKVIYRIKKMGYLYINGLYVKIIK